MAVCVVLLDLDVAPHVDEAGLAGAWRGAGDGAHSARAPSLRPAPGPALPPLLHAQTQVGRQPVRPDPVLHREEFLSHTIRFRLSSGGGFSRYSLNASRSHKVHGVINLILSIYYRVRAYGLTFNITVNFRVGWNCLV